MNSRYNETKVHFTIKRVKRFAYSLLLKLLILKMTGNNIPFAVTV